ncbi:helix-turn-helix domain-containing protein [Gorillibacterium massiliense]|uniref:helix-turn-helix domain-containing protein n=1 Tax=Gorillibacterium massiliense TaxID=1280390 RepID=UPI0004AE6C83|nr:helix-turn-helix transcriptional regulator [Gorillibacterium massiliense]
MAHRGDRIALQREKRSMTQEDLSAKLGITRAALSHYEKNRREPDSDTLNKIADFFSISIDYLLGRTDEPNRDLEPNIRDFVDDLELSDEKLLEQFNFTIDGRKLTTEESRRFIAFIRAERSMSK